MKSQMKYERIIAVVQVLVAVNRPRDDEAAVDKEILRPEDRDAVPPLPAIVVLPPATRIDDRLLVIARVPPVKSLLRNLGMIEAIVPSVENLPA